MADSGEVSVKFKIHGDKKGADEIAGGISNIKHRAAEANSKLTAGAQQSAGAFQKLSGSVGFLRRALTGFGAVALFSGIISGISKLKESFGAAQKAAEEFNEKQKEIKASAELTKLQTAYKGLADAVAQANQESTRELDLIDRKVQARRKLESAELEAQKQAALAELSPDSIIYEQQKAQIEADFAARAETQKLANEKEDIVLKRQRENEKAELKDKEAEAQDEQTALLYKKLGKLMLERSAADLASTELNDKDKTGGFLDATAKNLGQFLTLDWGRLTKVRTAEGDEERKRNLEKTGQLDEAIIQLKDEIRQSKEKSSELRAQGEHHRQVADSYSDELKANRIRREMADRAALKAERDTQAAKEAKMTEVNDARASLTALEAAKAQNKQRQAAAQAQKDEAGRAVFAAQGDLEASQRRGDKRETQEQFYQKLQDALAQQKEVNFAADKLLEAIAQNQKDIEHRLKACSDYLNKTDARQQYAWSESASAE